jgi:hypothetical protein
VTAQLDHVVVGARTLDEGVAWCRRTLGVEPGPGGTHPLIGTHNRLLRLNDAGAFVNAYLEIIAIDPQAAPPGRARWFGLDAVDLSGGPRLLAFVARVPDLDAALAALRDAGVDGGRALAATRETPHGLLRWRIAVRDDGVQPCGGACPTLIEWGERHPAASMPASGVALRELVVRGLPPAVPGALGVSGVQVEAAAGPALTCRLDTPAGAVTLESR